jgi:hypothetical protein
VTLEAFTALYLALGVAGALVVAGAGRGLGHAAVALVLWPLAVPFAFAIEEPAAGREAAFVAALRKAAATPLGGVLPDEAVARALAARLGHAASRVAEIDGVLARPEMSEAAARSRLAELERRAGTGAATAGAIAAATSRLDNLHRLRQLRDRCAAELEEVGELIDQLTAQAELVRLSGATDPAGAELVRELVARVEGLDQLLREEEAAA